MKPKKGEHSTQTSSFVEEIPTENSVIYSMN